MRRDDASSDPDLHRCSDPPVQANASHRVAGLCANSRRYAIEHLYGRKAPEIPNPNQPDESRFAHSALSTFVVSNKFFNLT